MSELAFININGNRIQVPLGAKPVAPLKEKPEPRAMSLGFKVLGFSKSHLEAAEYEWAAEGKKKRGFSPFDPDAYMRSRKGFPINSRNYTIREAAADCKALAEKDGWVNVTIIEIKRNVEKE